MANYGELAAIMQDERWNDLLDKMMVSCIIKAHEIVDEPTSVQPLHDWALAALESPKGVAMTLAAYVIAENRDLSVDAIYTAPDAAIQSNVNQAVEAMYGV